MGVQIAQVPLNGIDEHHIPGQNEQLHLRQGQGAVGAEVPAAVAVGKQVVENQRHNKNQADAEPDGAHAALQVLLQGEGRVRQVFPENEKGHEAVEHMESDFHPGSHPVPVLLTALKQQKQHEGNGIIGHQLVDQGRNGMVELRPLRQGGEVFVHISHLRGIFSIIPKAGKKARRKGEKGKMHLSSCQIGKNVIN